MSENRTNLFENVVKDLDLETIEFTSDQMLADYEEIIRLETKISNLYNTVPEDLVAHVYAALHRKICEKDLPVITRQAMRTWT